MAAPAIRSNFSPKPQDKTRFADAVVQHFGNVMDTGTDHVAVTLRCGAREDLVFGRAGDPSRGIVFLNATFAAGGRRTRSAGSPSAVIDELGRVFDVPRSAVYVIFTGTKARSSRCTTASCLRSAGEDPLEDLG